jgi:hypothetical protein
VARARGRGERKGIAFMVVWLVLWSAGILIAIWTLGASAWNGEPEAMIFIAVWLAAAGFALYAGVRRLLRDVFQERTLPPVSPRHEWDDGLPPSSG